MSLYHKERVKQLPPPGAADRLKRVLWNAVQATAYRFSPNVAFGYRRALLRAFGATLAKTARPYPKAKIWAPWNLKMDAGSCLANDVNCYNVATVHLHVNALVSQGAYLCTASHDFRRKSFDLMAGEITIAENSWVTTEAFVGPGVTIGERAIVGARAVTVKDVGPDQIVVGNPAKCVGLRTVKQI